MRKPAGEGQLGALVQLVLGGVEERLAEAEGDRAADHRQAQVADRRERGQRPPHEEPGALDDGQRGALWRPPGLLLDRRSAAVGLQAAAAAAVARATLGLDDDVPEVAGVAQPSVEQPSAAHQPAADTRAHHDPDEVAHAHRGTAPGLAERERLGVVVDDHGELGELLHLGGQREALPGGDVQWRDLATVGIHRAPATHAAADRVVRCRGEHPQHEARQRRPHVARRRGDAIAHEHRARLVDDPGRQLRAADVDREVAAGHVTDRNRSNAVRSPRKAAVERRPDDDARGGLPCPA